jgi:hypothetical protein
VDILIKRDNDCLNFVPVLLNFNTAGNREAQDISYQSKQVI